MDPMPSTDLTVVASTPSEMVAAQSRLIAWAEAKLASEQGALGEKQQNLELSKQMKVRTEGWKREVLKASKRVTFYEKLLKALQSGYCLIPAMPMTVFAIRAKRNPPKKTFKKPSRWWTPKQIDSANLPQGEGRYVDPSPSMETWEEFGPDGQAIEMVQTVGLDEGLDFPFKVVKPQVLQNLQQALKLGIFDELGVVPLSRPKGDPMILGTIVHQEGRIVRKQYFLVAWWVDTVDL